MKIVDFILSMSILMLFVLMFTSCTQLGKTVKVIKTPSEATVYRFHLEDGDNLVCDKESCRVVRN